MRGVLGDVEMRRLNTALSDGVGHEEEVKLTIDDLRLLNEACVDVGALRRVIDPILAVWTVRLLEETLTHTLVYDDEGDVRGSLGRRLVVTTILHANNAVELGELLINDLLAHGVANTVTVDEDVARHGTIVELAVGREGALEVVREDRGRDNLLALDRLRAGLRIVLAHVGVVRCAEADGRLLALVAHIDADEHSLLRNLVAEGHAPEVAAKLGIHLPDDVEEDSVIVFGDSAVGDELRDHGCITVDLVL